MPRKRFRSRNQKNKFSPKKRDSKNYFLFFSVVILIFVAVYLYYDLEIYNQPESNIGGDNFGPSYKSDTDRNSEFIDSGGKFIIPLPNLQVI